MQKGESENLKWDVVVGSLPGDYVVETFTKDYSRYIESEGVGAPAGFFSFIAFLIGVVFCLVSFLTIILGPPTVMVNILAGPTALQFIQIYSGRILSVSAIVIVISSWVLRRRAVLSPEEYLLHYYSVLCSDSTELNERIIVQHMGGNIFHISLKVGTGTTSAE